MIGPRYNSKRARKGLRTIRAPKATRVSGRTPVSDGFAPSARLDAGHAAAVRCQQLAAHEPVHRAVCSDSRRRPARLPAPRTGVSISYEERWQVEASRRRHQVRSVSDESSRAAQHRLRDRLRRLLSEEVAGDAVFDDLQRAASRERHRRPARSPAPPPSRGRSPPRRRRPRPRMRASAPRTTASGCQPSTRTVGPASARASPAPAPCRSRRGAARSGWPPRPRARRASSRTSRDRTRKRPERSGDWCEAAQRRPADRPPAPPGRRPPGCAPRCAATRRCRHRRRPDARRSSRLRSASSGARAQLQGRPATEVLVAAPEEARRRVAVADVHCASSLARVVAEGAGAGDDELVVARPAARRPRTAAGAAVALRPVRRANGCRKLVCPGASADRRQRDVAPSCTEVKQVRVGVAARQPSPATRSAPPSCVM